MRHNTTITFAHINEYYAADSVSLVTSESGSTRRFTLDLDPAHYESALYGGADEINSFLSYLQPIIRDMSPVGQIDIEMPATLQHEADTLFYTLINSMTPETATVSLECEEGGPFFYHYSDVSSLEVFLSRCNGDGGATISINQRENGPR